MIKNKGYRELLYQLYGDWDGRPNDKVIESCLGETDCARELEKRIDHLLDKLSFEEGQVLRYRFGLGVERLTQEQIAATLVTGNRSLVQKLERKGLSKLRHPIRSRGIGKVLLGRRD